MALLIKFDGTEEVVLPADPEAGFNLREIYTLLGCEMIEVVYLSAKPGYILILDEEGKFKKDWLSRINEKATAMLRAGNHIPEDLITGDVLLIKDDGKEFQ